jgi:glycosyltransferase involved in cell wall biosynthesis
MSGSAHEPTRRDRKTETPVHGKRFRRRPGPAEPTMLPDTFLPHRFTCLAVVPAYNEAATVARVIESLHRKTPALDVLVIDDGSTDTTALLAERAGAKVLRMPFNVGIGGAVQAGFKFAHENGYDFMVQVDGDGQHDPGEITKLFAAVQGGDHADMICGSRFATDTGYIAPISRRTGIHLFAFLLSRLLHQPITDPTSGFRLYNHRAIALFARDYPHDYPEVEAVLMLHHHRLTMREVPVLMFQRGGGVSSIGSGKSFYYMVKVLLALFVGLGRRRAVPGPGEPAPVAADHGI